MTIAINARLLHHYKRVSRLLESLDPQAAPRAYLSPGSAPPGKNVIVFPGSFNPPTTAHLALLKQARKLVNREGGHWQTYAALSRQIVDKEEVMRMTLLDRVVLLERVLHQEVRDAGVLLLNRGLYVEQAQGIRATFPQIRRLYFLLGFDKIVQVLDPRYYTRRDAALCQLFRLAHLLVAPRGNDGTEELQRLLALPANRPFARYIHPLPLAESYRYVSSTQARQEQPACATTSVLPVEVRDFLARTHPYTPAQQEDGAGERDLYAARVRALERLINE